MGRADQLLNLIGEFCYCHVARHLSLPRAPTYFRLALFKEGAEIDSKGLFQILAEIDKVPRVGEEFKKMAVVNWTAFSGKTRHTF